MVRAAKSIFAVIALLVFAASFSYCETVNVDDLVGQYNSATGAQRLQVENAYKYKTVSVVGTVRNVKDWETFDERTDTTGLYYKVITETQMTGGGISYQLMIFYKDKNKADALDKGQAINTSGAFVKIIDEIGIFSVWVYADELTAEDKVMLGL